MDVICINDSFEQRFIEICPNRPVQDSIYSIRDIRKTRDGKTGVLLNELENPPVSEGEFSFEPGFDIERFRRLDGSPLKREHLKTKKYVPVFVPAMPRDDEDPYSIKNRRRSL